jgi:hypothetical protein
VLPNEAFLVRANVSVTLRFRVADVEYTLSGSTAANDVNDDIVVNFDSVTRKRMAALGEHLNDRGLLEACKTAAIAPQEPPRPESAAKPRPTKDELRRVRREKPPGGIERRVHHRHELEAVATLLIVNKGTVIKCLLLEISRSGCRVFSDAPFRIESETPVEVDFIGNGYPLRISAKVKVKTDEYVLGLEFQHMSSRTVERLLDLLVELGEDCSRL